MNILRIAFASALKSCIQETGQHSGYGCVVQPGKGERCEESEFNISPDHFRAGNCNSLRDLAG
jgi:hypothetical protein